MRNAGPAKIVIASVLKPVDDVRMAQKIGISLSEKLGAEVHIIGKHSGNNGHANLSSHAVAISSRLSVQRFVAPWKILGKVVRLKPTLLIITTHELLLVAALSRFITGCRVVYDVQENYYRNIRYTTVFPAMVRPVLAAWARAREKLFAGIIVHFFLAERSYSQEMSFFKDRYTVIENKALRGTRAKAQTPVRNLLFSGTLADTTGVLIAIEMAKALHVLDPAIRLTIIGYCQQPDTLRKIKREMRESSFLELIGGDVLVPHEAISRAIAAADVGIISYPKNPSTDQSTPTKLYEYLAHQLPILLIEHPQWQRICDPYNAAVTFNPHGYSPQLILKQLNERQFYTVPPKDVLWESEEKKLIDAITKLV